MKETDIELLRRIAEVEDGLDPNCLTAKLGWRSRDVSLWPGTLTKLRMKGFIEDFYESNSYHGYKLTEAARALVSGASLLSPTETPQGQEL